MMNTAKLKSGLAHGITLLAAFSTAIAVPTASMAQTIYEARGVFPGQIIVNRARVVDQETGRTITTAETDITVSSFDSFGTLRAYELFLPGDDRPRKIFRFLGADYSSDGSLNGGLVEMPAPEDVSTLTGHLGIVDTSSPLELVETEVVRHGTPVFFVLQDQALNLRSDRQDTALVTVTDAITGDTEVLRFYETGPDTGEFTAWINTRRIPTEDGNGIMSTVGFSRIDASYVDVNNAENSLATEVMVGPIDPYGSVFDSATGQVINGVTVTLIDVETGEPAEVFSEDVTSNYPATVETGGSVTDAAGNVFQLDPGEYRFPYVYPGIYRFEIEAPEGYDAPSLATDAQLDGLAGGIFEIGTGSRLEDFEIVPGPALQIDIPLDRRTSGDIDRTANKDVVAIGDIFEYTVNIEAPQTSLLDIVDTLPSGIRFVPGTMLIDGKPIDPQVSPDGLTLTISDLPVFPGQAIVLTYAAQARLGASTTRTYPSYSDAMESNTGRLRMRDDHDLRVVDAFRLDDMPIVGQVVAGGCGMEPIERDLSNIRILLETGDYVLTDEKGRFSFRGIENRPRVIQMDQTTIPRNAKPVLCTNNTRSSGSAISQFIDVKEGMMARVEFYLEFDASAEIAEVSEAEEDFKPVDPILAFDDDYALTIKDDAAPQILTPTDGFLPYSEAIDLAFLRPSDLTAKVYLNGELVNQNLAERPSMSPGKTIVLDRYRSIRINEGRNLIRVELTNAAGEVVHDLSSEVLYATKVADMELVASGSVLESDGRTTPVVRMQLRDENGYPVRPGTIVSISVDEPFKFMPDVRRNSEPGAARRPSSSVTTTVREDGIVKLTLAPAYETWRANFRIQTEDGDITEKVKISAAERPWVVVGIAEGTLAEKTIRDNMRKSGDIGGNMSGRIGLFAEGVIRGDWLLTLRIDTARGREGDDAFSGIDPEADYVVYGDRSVQDNAAKSRFPIYLRLRKEGAEYLVGDFNTGISTELVNLSRDVTGARALFENDTYKVMAFVAETSQRYVEDRIALNGTLGPYQLTRGDIISGSETVRLIEISRIDASREIASVTLVEGLDYTLSTSGGRVFLNEPIPAFTEDGNRNVLVVGYEADEDVASGLLAGVRAEVQVSERARIGATAIYATRVDGTRIRVSLVGVDATFEVNENLTLKAEAIEVRKTDGSARIRGGEAEIRADFDDGINTASAYVNVTRGNTEIDASLDDRRSDRVGAEFSVRLSEGSPIYDEDGKRMTEEENQYGLFLQGEYAGERDIVNATRGQDAELLVVRKSPRLSYGAGVRLRERISTTEELRAAYAVGDVSWTTKDERLTFGISAEASVFSEGVEAHDRLTLSAEYAVSEKLSFTGSFEATRLREQGDLSGVFSLGATYQMNENGELSFGIANAFNGEGSGSAVTFGLDQTISLSERTELSFGMTAQRDLGAFDVPLGLNSGNPFIAESFTSATLGLRHTRDTWSTGVDLEILDEEIARTTSLRFSVDGDLNEAWSLGGEASFIRIDGAPENSGTEVDLKFAASHRRGPRDPITLFQIEMERLMLGNGVTSEIYGSVYHTRYLSEKDLINLRAGLKYVSFAGDFGSTSDTLGLIGAEWRHDFTDKVDFGLHGSMMHSAATGDSKSSYGVSVGVSPFENGYLSVGYNFDGYKEDDFSESGYTDKGAFVQFRVKIDSDTLKDIFR